MSASDMLRRVQDAPQEFPHTPNPPCLGGALSPVSILLTLAVTELVLWRQLATGLVCKSESTTCFLMLWFWSECPPCWGLKAREELRSSLMKESNPAISLQLFPKTTYYHDECLLRSAMINNTSQQLKKAAFYRTVPHAA